MDLIISAKNFKLTPSLKTFATAKFTKLARFWRQIVRVRVELSVERSRQAAFTNRVDVKVEVPGPDINAEYLAADMHEAIDMIIPKLERQIAKVKGKLERRRQLRGKVL